MKFLVLLIRFLVSIVWTCSTFRIDMRQLSYGKKNDGKQFLNIAIS